MLNVRRLLDEGVNVGLGTDVSGGASPSMLSAIREACKVSNMVSVSTAPSEGGSRPTPLSTAEAFHLATRGGAHALGVDHLTGDFSLGVALTAANARPHRGVLGS